MPKYHRDKGARGERELARFLADHGHDAHRGRQYHGGCDSPDVVCPSLPLHFECKRVERLRLQEAMTQAIADCPPGKVPIVAHKANGRPWLAVMRLADLLEVFTDEP